MMNLNPYQSAVLASVYIVGVVHLIQFFSRYGDTAGGEDIILIPIMMLSLLTLSVAVMGFLFGYGPLTLYLDGKKHEAVTYVLKTIGTFALCTVVFVLAYVFVVTNV